MEYSFTSSGRKGLPVTLSVGGATLKLHPNGILEGNRDDMIKALSEVDEFESGGISALVIALAWLAVHKKDK